jgi:predicted peptidase
MTGWKLVALSLAGLCGLGVLPARAADADKQGFVDRVYKDAEGKEYKYVVFVPHDYKGDKPYPVILFLHGAGETGNDGEKQVRVGLGKAIKKQEQTFPCITVFPQAHTRGWGADSPSGKTAIAILDQVMKDYKCDPNRVYLTGLSMGGMGTWSMAIKYPQRWAAIVPICGRGDPKQAEKIKDIPCWCFHGDADTAVSVEGSRQMIAALKAAGGSPKYSEYPGVGHNSWDKAYGTPELYEWLLKQHQSASGDGKTPKTTGDK